jgi:nucleoside-diphosphate-sugar epimerase
VKALVTGGGGFLGEALVRALVARGDQVRTLARGEYPALTALGVETVRGDLADVSSVERACEGVDVVFHTAAKAGGWGPVKEFEATNVTGTANVIAACEKHGVRALVYTSTPSVVHAHRDLEGETEALPYASTFTADYPRTKAIAERAVRAAKVPSISIRPHFIWGPGDHHLLPRLLARSRAGRLRQVGSRDVKTDTVFIDNCVHAHLLAADALLAKKVSGNPVYFVSDDAPVGVWTMANRMLAAAGAPKVGRPIPAWVASAVGATLEGVHAAFSIQKEPLMTRFAASELSHAQWFDISAIKRDLGYAPRVTVDEGFARLEAWCREHRP